MEHGIKVDIWFGTVTNRGSVRHMQNMFLFSAESTRWLPGSKWLEHEGYAHTVHGLGMCVELCLSLHGAVFS
jgi:hypothetical protein